MYNNLKTFSQTHPATTHPLTNEETQTAVAELSIHSFPKINRRFVDPSSAGSLKYALFSYIPTLNYKLMEFINNTVVPLLTPEQIHQLNTVKDSDIHGVAKIRGAFYTIEEANQASEHIIQHVDSTNSIFTCEIGVPFPLTAKGLAEETVKIDVKNLVEKTIAENIKNKRRQEQLEMEEIHRRAEESKKPVEHDPEKTAMDNYTTARVKLCHLKYAIDKHVEERNKAIENRDACIEYLLSLEKEYPEFNAKFMDFYKAGRKAANVSDNYAFEGFIKYLSEPIEKPNNI